VLVISLTINAQEVKQLSTTVQIDSLIKANSGKTLMINLWATWCEPCVEEFPDLIKLYKDYRDKNFVLVFISLDQPGDLKTKVIPFLKDNGVDFTTYINGFKKQEDMINSIDRNWDGAIPATYIFDNAGVITSSLIGGKTYDEFLNEVKKNLPND
jgi:thiol-disulfide isomerase/thioredoxin